MKILLILCLFLFSISTYSQDTLTVFTEEDSLAVPLDSTRLRVLEAARACLGVPYRYGQAGPESFDCSGFVKFVYDNLGYTLPRSSYEQYKKSERVRAKDALPGDLVFFATRKRSVGHVGIYLGNNEFIHAPGKGKTVSITNLEGPYYKRRLVGFGGYL